MYIRYNIKSVKNKTADQIKVRSELKQNFKILYQINIKLCKHMINLNQIVAISLSSKNLIR